MSNFLSIRFDGENVKRDRGMKEEKSSHASCITLTASRSAEGLAVNGL